ncbi:MAG: YARHG domain-containing protein [Lachnospiraceae bacterium]
MKKSIVFSLTAVLMIILSGVTGCSSLPATIGTPDQTEITAATEAISESTTAEPTTAVPQIIAPESTVMPTASTEAEYILPESDSRYYTQEELSQLTTDQLRLARNEIFARRGRKFTSNELQNYFQSKSWYTPLYEPEEFEAKGDAMFNDYEIANRNHIIALEQQQTGTDPFAGLTFYGSRIFGVTSYTINGSTITLTGNIYDSGYATEEYLKSLKIGDTLEGYGTVTELYHNGYIKTRDNQYDDTVIYHLGPDSMGVAWLSGGEGAEYRLIKENITLNVEQTSKFNGIKSEWDPESFPATVSSGLTYWRIGEPISGYTPVWFLRIKKTTGNHINELEDIPGNYAG